MLQLVLVEKTYTEKTCTVVESGFVLLGRPILWLDMYAHSEPTQAPESSLGTLHHPGCVWALATIAPAVHECWAYGGRWAGVPWLHIVLSAAALSSCSFHVIELGSALWVCYFLLVATSCCSKAIAVGPCVCIEGCLQQVRPGYRLLDRCMHPLLLVVVLA